MIKNKGNIKANIKRLLKSFVPASVKRRFANSCSNFLSSDPPIGRVNFGHFRRLKPISNAFGAERGQIIDRYYIERFLNVYANDISGHVLEIGDDRYTKQIGRDNVNKSDVLHLVEGSPGATIISDLTKADNIASNTFECIIITQTLQFIFDVRAAVRHLHRILKPHGVILATFHGTSKIDPFIDIDSHPWNEYWRFTSQSSRILFEEVFNPGNVKVHAYGNILTAISFLHGLAAEELRDDELDYQDPYYEVLIGVRGLKEDK